MIIYEILGVITLCQLDHIQIDLENCLTSKLLHILKLDALWLS